MPTTALELMPPQLQLLQEFIAKTPNAFAAQSPSCDTPLHKIICIMRIGEDTK